MTESPLTDGSLGPLGTPVCALRLPRSLQGTVGSAQRTGLSLRPLKLSPRVTQSLKQIYVIQTDRKK